MSKMAKYEKFEEVETENNKEIEILLTEVMSYASEGWREFLKNEDVNIDRLSKKNKNRIRDQIHR